MKKKKQKKTDAAGKYTLPAAGPGWEPSLPDPEQPPRVQRLPYRPDPEQPPQVQRLPYRPDPARPQMCIRDRQRCGVAKPWPRSGQPHRVVSRSEMPRAILRGKPKRRGR